jgi:hypothetical protein
MLLTFFTLRKPLILLFEPIMLEREMLERLLGFKDG